MELELAQVGWTQKESLEVGARSVDGWHGTWLWSRAAVLMHVPSTSNLAIET